MPTLPTQSFSTIVQNIAAGIQGRATALLNFSQGSTLRAIAEGFAGTFLWFQAMMLQLLSAIRLSTSSGVDVDTFTADFMPVVVGTTSPRLGSQPASGQVTFSRATAGPSSCFVPVGSTLQTADGTTVFAVTADPTYSSYTAGPPAGYVMPSAVGTLVVPVQAQQAGSASNVFAGEITVITSNLTGIDSVVNLAAFTNGFDTESDSALKKRFSDYILGLSRGDIYGLTSSLEGVDVEIQWTLTENYNYDGSWRPGYFFVVADDGSGNPSPAFLTAMGNAADAVRPLGIQFAVFPPVIIFATVSLQLTTDPTFNHQAVEAAVSAAIATNINSLGLGNELPWSILAGWAYAVPGVTQVSNVLLNGLSGDAASLTVTRATQDTLGTIAYATVKCRTVVAS